MNERKKDDIRRANSEHNKYVLTLFVSGESPRSKAAIRNLKQICKEYLSAEYAIEVIDIKETPEAAEEKDIVAVPTLIKRLPPPLSRIVGDLSRTEKVLVGLGLYTNGVKR